MDLVGLVSGLLGIGLGAGLNLYATVLTLGLAMRFGWIHGLPAGLEVLSHPAVLAVAGVMYLAEFAADKIPGFTPIWDSIHTFIRPVGGALLAYGAAAKLDPMMQMVALLLGGSLALGTHATKMGTRLAAHTVPDPVTHSVISMAEDVSVVGILALAYSYPWVALPLLGACVVGIAAAVPFLYRVLRFLFRTVSGRLLSWTAPDEEAEVPAWAKVDGGRVTKGFVRSGKGLGRLRSAFLSEASEGATLRVSAMFGQKQWKVERISATVEGLFLDFIELRLAGGTTASLYLTKDWGRYRRQGRGAAAVAR